MKLFKLVIASFILLLSCSLAMAHESKVGFINPQQIIMESKIGKIAQQDLAKMGQEKDRIIREARENVQSMQRKLEGNTLTSIERGSIDDSIRVAVRDYEKLMEQASMDLQGEERRLIKFIMGKADTILRQLAKEQGFTMILTDPEAIGYVDGSMDLTGRVIRELDALQ